MTERDPSDRRQPARGSERTLRPAQARPGQGAWRRARAPRRVKSPHLRSTPARSRWTCWITCSGRSIGRSTRRSRAIRSSMRLAVRDRAFARLLVTTVLRRLGQIDHTALPLLRYRPKELRGHQHAAAGCGPAPVPVDAAARRGGRDGAPRRRRLPARGAAAQRRAAQARRRRAAGCSRARMPPRLNTPKWLWDSWAAAYGEERARAIAEAHQGEPPLDLSVHARRRALGRASSGPRSCRPARCAGAAAAWSRRCPATTRASGGCRTRRRPCPPCCWGRSRAGACSTSAPHPAARRPSSASMGAKVTALERSPRRAEFLVRNLGRLTLDAEIVVADALEWQAAGALRRRAARRALHRHRHHPPPSGRALVQVAGRRRAAGRGAGPAAGGRDRDAEARRGAGLRRLLAAARGGAAADRGAARRRRAGRARPDRAAPS